MDMDKKNTNFNISLDGGLKIKNVLSIVSGVTGALCFLFLLTRGINFTQSFYPTYFTMGQMIFGSEWAGINPGLLSAFIIMAAAIVFDLLMNLNDLCGYISILCFITSAVLWFCTIPLYGNYSATLGAGAWCLGVFNVVDAILTFVGLTYR